MNGGANQLGSNKRGILQLEPPTIPVRPSDGHKGTFGSVLIVAGSRGMSGAASLCGRAALHGGAGLVTVAVPEAILDVVAGGHPSYMTYPLSVAARNASPAQAAKQHLRELQPLLSRQTAFGIGPGLGTHEATASLVGQLYVELSQPAVFDADALNILSQEPERLRAASGPRVLTPHPGEFSRLTGFSIKQIQRNRVDMAIDFARQHQLVLLLKGAGTIITDGDRYAINDTGSSALATGGSGDVLTGLVAALLAQGMDPFEAAYLAAYLHGLAGEIAGQQYSEQYATSVEILHCLSKAWLQARQKPQ